mmetsp:Transcript_19402/g.34583  ORF Transcript_19402/g.34583 Transcript_19402/m.34583 type:complete len:131 (+) Transcript_19402:1412-1804(+)
MAAKYHSNTQGSTITKMVAILMETSTARLLAQAAITTARVAAVLMEAMSLGASKPEELGTKGERGRGTADATIEELPTTVKESTAGAMVGTEINIVDPWKTLIREVRCRPRPGLTDPTTGIELVGNGFPT